MITRLRVWSTLLPLIVGIGGVFVLVIILGSQAVPAASAPDQTALQPQIVITPTYISVELSVGDVLTTLLMFSNIGDQTLNYTITEMSYPEGELAALPTRTRRAGLATDELLQQVSQAGQSRAIIYLRHLPDLSAATQVSERSARVAWVYQRLLAEAARSQDLFDWLVRRNAEPRWLLTASAIAATLDQDTLNDLLRLAEDGTAGSGFAEIAYIDLNSSIYAITDRLSNEHQAPQPYIDWLPGAWLPGPGNPAVFEWRPETVEWNIQRIGADQAWSTFGITGTGVTVGLVDTGVQYNHAALADQYRGNLGGGSYNHNYNWYDFLAGSQTPYDDHGHGTMVDGFIVGDDGSANQIGVAPGARWIAVKVLNAGGGGTLEDLHAGLQWMLAPTDLTGANPDPGRAPQVVMNAWGGINCDTEFQPDLVSLVAANILPVFAPGAQGPGCGYVASPADLPQAFSAGATDNLDHIGPFSARGPSCFGEIKPDAAAPGVQVRTSINNGMYTTVSGTSFASAHLAGAAAMVFSADPSLSTNQVEQIIASSALCIYDNVCGGDPCPGDNNTYGAGRIDVFEAVSLTLGMPPYDLPWVSETPTSGSLPAGGSAGISVTLDATSLAPGLYTGALRVESNDPISPTLILPISLNVLTPCDLITATWMTWEPITPTLGSLITFTAQANGSPPIEFAWDFGDSTTGSGQTITHIYQSPGTYTVQLTATNACSLLAVEETLAVLPPPHLFIHIPLVLRQ